MMTVKKPSFEEALTGLEKSAEDLRKENITLEAAIKSFEEGITHYKQCNEILSEAKQKIEVYSK